MTKKEKLIIFLLASINFSHILDFMIIMPLGNNLMSIFKISPAQFSLVVTAYTFSAGISSFIASFFADRFDRKNLLLFGFTGFLIGTLLCALSKDYYFLLFSRIVAGTFGGLISAQVQSIIADVFEYERRATAMGFLTAAFSVASVFGVPLGIFLANYFNWHAPFIFVVLFGCIILPLVMFYIPKINAHLVLGKQKTKKFETIEMILKNREQRKALLLTGILMVGHFSIIPFIAPSMELNVGFSSNNITMMYFLGGLFTIFTSPLIGKLSDKFGKHQILYIFGTLSLIPIYLITVMNETPLAFALFITTLFFVFAGGRMIPVMTMVSNVVEPKQRGSFMSINSSIQQIAVGIASYISGLIVVKNPHSGKIENYNYVGYIAIAASILCLILASRLKSQSKSQANK